MIMHIHLINLTDCNVHIMLQTKQVVANQRISILRYFIQQDLQYLTSNHVYVQISCHSPYMEISGYCNPNQKGFAPYTNPVRILTMYRMQLVLDCSGVVFNTSLYEPSIYIFLFKPNHYTFVNICVTMSSQWRGHYVYPICIINIEEYYINQANPIPREVKLYASV